MVDPKELRLNNLILFKSEIMRVDSIFAEQLFLINSTKTISSCFTAEEVDAIPLTPEILEACGFEPNTNKSWYRKSFCEWMVGPDGLSNIVLGTTNSPNGLPIHVGIEQRTDDGFTIQEAAEIQRHEYTMDDDALILKHKQTSYITPINYLHQLQNLYFALTGTELSVNLDKIKV